MTETEALLDAYDAQMRMPPGFLPAGVTHERDGPILRVVGGNMGRIRAPRDVGLTGTDLDDLIVRQREYFRARGEAVEWKLRAHDLPSELPERLVAAGFTPQTTAAVMLGLADVVASDPVVPDGVVLRRVTAPEDLRRIAEHQSEVWQEDIGWLAHDLISRTSSAPDQITVLAGEADGRIICDAWSIYHPGTEFVAFLGGTTSPQWRRRGLYRAMVATRAQEAAARGFRLLHVDASPYSEPILHRCGFHKIATSTWYEWTPEK